MKESTAVKLYLVVCALAVGICIYAVINEGFEENKMTIFYTLLFFGGVGLFWAVYNKLSKQ